nr:Trm112 family protein [Mucilaginibacter sp. L294]
MKLNTIAKLCCPFDKQDLQLKTLAQDLDQNVIEGILSCKTCLRNYPIIYGVPIMAPDEYRQIALEQPR